ncbi:VOC family protein [Planotetraspora sp. GP83]|uniref:VOC family protein n=1 Tax=Planotetraspora sp. GP83 TaxID=3156264 RepID=UPI0035119273
MATFTFHHVSLSVADLDAQRDFYCRAFGLVEEYHVEWPESGMRLAVLSGPGGTRIELTERAGSSPQSFADAYDAAGVQSYSHWGLATADLDAAFAAITSAGAEPVSPPANASRQGTRYAYVKDLEGNLIELIGR